MKQDEGYMMLVNKQEVIIGGYPVEVHNTEIKYSGYAGLRYYEDQGKLLKIQYDDDERFCLI